MSFCVGLVGSDVSGSPSPAIHRAAFDSLGLNAWRYSAIEVGRGALPARWRELAATHSGLNVTAPHKEVAASLVDQLTPAAALAGSVNTVVFSSEGALGATTDGLGLVRAIERTCTAVPHRVLVLGTGGAARAIVAALIGAGSVVMVSGRNESAGRALVAALSGVGPGTVAFAPMTTRAIEPVLAEADLLVNATPVGSNSLPGQSPLPPRVVPATGSVVFDVVYRPRMTPLLQLAEEMGCTIVFGLEMLLEQAALSFKMWTGREASIEVMRNAARAALPSEEGLRS